MKEKIKKQFKHLKNGIKHGYRSGLELLVAEQLEQLEVPVVYEKDTFKFIEPAKKRKYTPDFKLPNGIYIETKGRFLSDDRKKLLLMKDQHPDIDIRLVFSNPNAKIYKGSPTKNWQWCERHGFKWAKKFIPVEWLNEKPRDKVK